jgi:hypothetical protein
MSEKKFLKASLYFITFVSIAIWSLLTWNYFNGGIPSHHLLARKDLPEVSNGWGALLLPLLTCWLLYRIRRRVYPINGQQALVTTFPKAILLGFFVALFLGILLATSFTFGNDVIPQIIMISILLLALIFPIYRSECILGFVLGMTYTFGAVLPIIISGLMALLGAIIYFLLRPVIIFGAAFFKKSSKD